LLTRLRSRLPRFRGLSAMPALQLLSQTT